MKKEKEGSSLGAAVPFQNRNYKFPSGVQAQLSLSSSTTAAGSWRQVASILSMSSRSLIRLGLLAGIGVRNRQMNRWTCNEKTVQNG